MYSPNRQRNILLVILTLLAPVMAQAGAWTTPSGTLWTKVSWFHQSTDEWYTDIAQPILLADNTLGERPAGSRRPYCFDGQYESTAAFIEGYYVLTDAIDIGLQVLWFDQSFGDDTRLDTPAESGFSDVRVFTRWRLFSKPFPVHAEGGSENPLG